MDVGLVGAAKGWHVIVGGSGGTLLRLSQRVLENVSTDEALSAERIVAWFKGQERSFRSGKMLEEIGLEDFHRKELGISGGPGILWKNRSMSEITEKGCDLQKECGYGLYCTVIRGKSNAWATMLAKYCHGSDYPLCARRIYFLEKGWCAPLDMTPIGILPGEILAEL